MLQSPALSIPESSQAYPLAPLGRAQCLVGRSEEAHLRLADPTVSRMQLAVWCEAGQYRLRNLSAHVAATVNGHLVTGDVPLAPGDRIRAGSTDLVFVDLDPFSRPAPADRCATVLASFDDQPAPAPTNPEIPLLGELVLGRDPGPGQVNLPHPTVSRRHAVLRPGPSGWAISDLGSANGTFVNGELVRGEHPLESGDSLIVGPFRLVFSGSSLLPAISADRAFLQASALTRDVPVRGGHKRILNQVSLAIDKGDFVCLLGPSGSGKSTLLEALCGRTPASSGEVHLDGASLYDNFEALKAGIAYVPQQNILHEDLTLGRALHYVAQLRLSPDSSPDELASAVEIALRRVGLENHSGSVIRTLSGGQKRRACLAVEILSRPEVLFLDEVTSGLDEETDCEMMRLFREMAEQGLAVVCVTHSLANVEEFCTKVAIMAPGGALSFYGPPRDALQFFGVQRLSEIYRRLKDSPARFVATPPALAMAPAHRVIPEPGHSRSDWGRQFRVLLARNLELISADRPTLATAALQSLLVGVLLAMVFGTPGSGGMKEQILLFFLGISCFWYGCNNASKELAKEQALYRRERDVNLHVSTYIASKFCALGVLVALQVLLLFAVTLSLSTVPGPASSQAFAMLLTGAAGTAAGLLISAVARTPDQANTFVPIVLIPQVLLSGAVVPELPLPAEWLARVSITGYWVFDGMCSVLASGLSGSLLPLSILAVQAVFGLAACRWALKRRESL